ncbi:hypothetical protein QAD02_018204, partial [Eretmocerus hayati]
MDNSAYVPNQLPAPAPPPPLVVFSQAAAVAAATGTFSEAAAFRMQQRPFACPQIGESKDLPNPFGQAAAAAAAAAGLDYRLHHMLQLQHQFLHPLDHRLPFGSSAFRPLAPSAFTPPPKRLKHEQAHHPHPPTSSSGPNGSCPSEASSPGPLTPSSMSSLFSPSATPHQHQQQQPNDLSGPPLAHSPANSHGSSRSPAGCILGAPPSAHSTPGLGGGGGGGGGGGCGPDGDERDVRSATPCSENTERSTPEEGRPYR